VSLSVIVPSGGRPTLSRTLASITPNLDLHDEVLVCVDQTAPWGNSSRNRLMRQAKGDWLLFMDDDDAYTPDAFPVIRAKIAQASDSVHIFRMRYPDGRELWTDREVRLGNVSTQMVVVPNRPPLGIWSEGLYEADYHFIKACADHRPVVWHEDVIALIRPED
jgi:glycosyltransferase involved in cell wall biosynthesis